jgi:hypothetical protein
VPALAAPALPAVVALAKRRQRRFADREGV